ncbi:hypothetical protein V2J09_010937 [Rumex salicifolius]
MEISSMVSSPRNSGVSDSTQHRLMMEEADEESGWTEYFVDYEVRRQTDDDADLETSYNSITVMSSSASMASDAGSGPDWILRNNNMMTNHSIPKRLNMNKAKPKEMPNHEESLELEDTASSPVTSPKINKYFKRMDINCGRRPEETFDTTYLGKAATSINEVDKAGKELADKGFCLVPYTELMKWNYYHTNLHRF